MNALLEPCFIGKSTNCNDCHKTWYKKEKGFKKLAELPHIEQQLLIWRSGLDVDDHAESMISPDNKICFHHHCKYISCYESKQKNCPNPFNIHIKTKKRKQHCHGQYTVTLKFADRLKGKVKLIPGQKLCKECWKKASSVSVLLSSTESSSLSESEEDSSTSLSGCQDNIASSLDESLGACGVSPFKSTGKSKRQKLLHANKKVEKAATNLGTAFATKGIEVTTSCLFQHKEDKETNEKTDLQDLMIDLKNKFNTVQSFQEKVEILTLKPNSWTIEETMSFFGATRHQVRKAITLKKDKGVLARPSRNKRSGIDETTINQVTSFYENDEYSRSMPGAKEYVSIAYKVHKQKRLLLCNLKELYSAYKENFPESTVGFSKFCGLRPKWCKVIGSAGGHAVCVCAIHQNAVLACNALCVDYKILMSKVVCDITNKLCMVHRCPNCPGKIKLLEFLHQSFINTDDEITFQQWVSTDRTTIINMVMDIAEFFDFLADKIDQLTSHSYIAKCQSRYLKQLKENLSLSPSTCIVLADFAENYAMVIQDAIQGWHWTKQQCTIHPIILYYINEQGILQLKSFAFFSDDLYHDTGFVYQLQKVLCDFIQINHPFITTIEYFSDGCSAQYKNYKNFLNLTYHYQDFGLDAHWNFFATSHGKSPCDGLGGSIKRKLTLESLGRTKEHPIITARLAFEFCTTSMPSTDFFFIETEDLTSIRVQLQERYSSGCTIPGTRSYHAFLPRGLGVISFKRTSEDDIVSGVHNFFKKSAAKVIVPKPHDYVAVTYDGFWWIGLVEMLETAAMEGKVKFMHPHGPSKMFFWPAKDDTCWVPFSNILHIVTSLTPTSRSGRSYKITESDFKAIIKLAPT